jgi:hypothetical protein
MTPRLRGVGPAAAALVVPFAALATTGCESPDQKATEQAVAQQKVCADTARAVALPTDYPPALRLPEGYLVTGVEHREGGRTVITAISPKEFKATLADMQASYSSRGWSLSAGEVEEADAESNFAGNGMKGRWAIRAMPSCAGNTGVSLVTASAG